jgi:DNA-binding transcriptional regulator YhcF (GntR family)
MGFKTSEWAWGVELPPVQKSVLVALAHRADDNTRECFPGQGNLAEMTGLSRVTISRAVGALEKLGVIARHKRRKNGYRTSDRYVIQVDTYVAESHVTESNVTDGYVTEGSTLDVSQTVLMYPSEGAVEQQSDEQSEEQSVLLFEPRIPTIGFDDFWKVWPRKVKRPDALKSWTRALTRTDASTIVAAATAYAQNPYRPQGQWIPHATTWLNNDCWNDDLQGPPVSSNSKPTPTDRAMEILALVTPIDTKAINR